MCCCGGPLKTSAALVWGLKGKEKKTGIESAKVEDAALDGANSPTTISVSQTVFRRNCLRTKTSLDFPRCELQQSKNTYSIYVEQTIPGVVFYFFSSGKPSDVGRRLSLPLLQTVN